MLDKSEMQSWSLEELLEKFRKNALAFQYSPNPDYQENIKAIKQEIMDRFNERPGNPAINIDKWKGQDTVVRVNGKHFYCKCGCNVFKNSECGIMFKCNACGSIHESI